MPNSDDGYEWIYCKSMRRGAKYHLFRCDLPMSVCRCVDRDRAVSRQPADLIDSSHQPKICFHCNNIARRMKRDR